MATTMPPPPRKEVGAPPDNLGHIRVCLLNKKNSENTPCKVFVHSNTPQHSAAAQGVMWHSQCHLPLISFTRCRDPACRCWLEGTGSAAPGRENTSKAEALQIRKSSMRQTRFASCWELFIPHSSQRASHSFAQGPTASRQSGACCWKHRAPAKGSGGLAPGGRSGKGNGRASWAGDRCRPTCTRPIRNATHRCPGAREKLAGTLSPTE